jgi:hypothetical protein
MTDCIPDQNIVEAAALQVCIEHSKVFRRGLEMLGISSSVPVHSANASARAEDATRGFNIRAGTTST